ncbi:MAG TPA: hypothetical protein VMM93_04435 [Vicinamibacterales bacterium]|nr:hypothetical protein [Vicinamibacterales bacterium]
MTGLADLEPKALARTLFDRVDAERLVACPDLVSVGMLAEAARRARHGDRVTYVRVAAVTAGQGVDRGEAGEVRLVGRPESVDEARARVRAAAPLVADAVLTGYSLADLVDLVGGDHQALADLARALSADGLVGVSAVPVDRFGDADAAVEAVRAARQGGLAVPRATVDRAPFEARLTLIERAEVVARETGALLAFAPLPEHDPVEEPSTGYDDVRTIALARLCTNVTAIQVSWALYGPKLAQVALAYGASDLDAVAAMDTLQLGRRRSPREDIERQIRAAFAAPAERDGRFEPR